MAVVKLKYTRGRKAIKAHIRYITHRPGREGERQSRTLFDRDWATDKQQAYQMINDAPRGTIFFKLVISPDPKREDRHKDLDLWSLTNHALSRLEEKLGKRLSFIAVEHSDHTPTRHVHTVLCLRGRLRRAEISLLRTAATQEAHNQSQTRELFARKIERIRAFTPFAGPKIIYRRSYSVRYSRTNRLCPRCLILTPMDRLRRGLFQCVSCHGRYVESQLGLAVQGAVWGR